MILWQFFYFVQYVVAHSWIDTIYANSSPNILGYPRNYAGHDASTSITEYKVLERDPTLPACGPSQRAASYSAQYPMLVVSAGSDVTATYLENGHVTKDKLPPDYLPHPGNYSWYISPKAGALTTFADLNDSSKLAGPFSFDDGKCAVDAAGIQGRQGPIPCLSHITIPATLPEGQYQLVWWWDFTKLTEIDPSYTEYYTTCLDIEVTNATSSTEAEASAIVATQAKAPAVVPSTTPHYANISFTPATPVATAAAADRILAAVPVEKDVLIITNEAAVVTSTFIYEHPIAILPTTTSSIASAMPTFKPSSTQVALVAGAANYLATMYVNPDDGSLSPYNMDVEANGLLRGVMVSVATAVAAPSSSDFPSLFTSTAAPTPSSNLGAVITSTPQVSVGAIQQEESTFEEVVTVYVPTYITIDAPCTPTAGTTSQELHTTVTMTKTVTL